MKTILTEFLDVDSLTSAEKFYSYNGLDCMITFEVFDGLREKLPSAGFAYDMARTMQAPAYVLQTRGTRIDIPQRDQLVATLRKRLGRCEEIFSRLCREGLDCDILPTSWQQLLVLFYEVLKLKPVMIYDRQKKTSRPSTNREALEKLQKEARAKPFVDLIFAMRDIAKQLQVLETGIAKGRMHCSYHVCGTLTGRFSSTKDPFGLGTNLQNVSDEMRRIFIADEGKKLCQLDLAQAESKIVAYLCLPWGDNYLRACQSGDLHTLAAKMVWPDLPWGNAPDREIAETKFYRSWSYRDLAKRGGHALNYGAKPATIAHHLQLPLWVAEAFYAAYFKAFPEILKWHNHVRVQLVLRRGIASPLGRFCHFPGRPTDNETIKSAIAYGPQSAIGDTLNRGFYKLWRRYDPTSIQILTQVHDSILFQYDPKDETELVQRLQQELVVGLEINGALCEIDSDAKVGWNWGKRISYKKSSGERVVENEFGLQDYFGSDTRCPPKELCLLDRDISTIHRSFQFA